MQEKDKRMTKFTTTVTEDNDNNFPYVSQLSLSPPPSPLPQLPTEAPGQRVGPGTVLQALGALVWVALVQHVVVAAELHHGAQRGLGAIRPPVVQQTRRPAIHLYHITTFVTFCCLHELL